MSVQVRAAESSAVMINARSKTTIMGRDSKKVERNILETGDAMARREELFAPRLA